MATKIANSLVRLWLSEQMPLSERAAKQMKIPVKL